MHDRDGFSDETPIADAVEQEQETTLESTTSDQEAPPAEADASDWQEQHQEIVGAYDDREEYRE
jgi:hypothetical protein